jgi:C4-dicarboxylate transporter, DctM subunit
VIGCGIFAAVSGSSAATCATIGKITLPELKRRATPTPSASAALAGAGTLRAADPAVHHHDRLRRGADVSIAKLFIAGVLPGVLLMALFRATWLWALRNPGRCRRPTPPMRLGPSCASRATCCRWSADRAGAGRIYSGLATATEAAALGVAGALVLSGLEGSLTWKPSWTA